MKNKIVSIILFVLVLNMDLSAQNIFGYWGEMWGRYSQEQENDLMFLRKRYFKDTVRVEEMKEAFLKYRDTPCNRSLFEGFDSVDCMGDGRNVMMISPLKHHPDKRVKECRSVWTHTYRYELIDLLDKNGVSQKKELAKLNNDKTRQWLDGEMLRLGEPRWYMGFCVSPRIYWEMFKEGKLLANVYSSHASPDFFSYATIGGFDGYWDQKIRSGARLLGAMCGLEYAANNNASEHTFSVLLYQKPTPQRMKQIQKPYTLELLEPSSPESETIEAFNSLKRFVESLPYMTFRPYYTTDFRIMTGRYYRVTVSRCGWLVEDYLCAPSSR